MKTTTEKIEKTDAELFAEMETKEKAHNSEMQKAEEAKTEPIAEVVKNEEKPIEVALLKDTSVFANKEAMDHNLRVAKMLATSELVPKEYFNKIANCMIAIEIANRIGASTLMVMQNLNIIHGRPSWSSQFLIATLNASGKFTPVRYEEDDKDGGRCRIICTDKSTGETCYGVWITMEMAKAEKWIDKPGSKWQTMPQHMRRFRAATFFTREFAPEISMGILTQDEAYDISKESTTASRWNKPE